MPSVFGHAMAAFAIGFPFRHRMKKPFVFILCMVGCAMLPDMDVLAFKWDVSYNDVWGHRGASHSVIMAFVWASICAVLFFRAWPNLIWVWMLLFLATVSHGLLDGLTNGGLGVAYFYPWDNTRYFLPYPVIQVSPIGVSRFFSKWGWEVIKSEGLWIGLPSIVWMGVAEVFRKLSGEKE